jgi:L-ascorbate metabolism protein UlaG (beta-lactamase superfamily)
MSKKRQKKSDPVARGDSSLANLDTVPAEEFTPIGATGEYPEWRPGDLSSGKEGSDAEGKKSPSVDTGCETILLRTPLRGGDIHEGSIYFVGTATVIVRFGGYTILTDPNFLHQGGHVHLGYGLTSTRLTQPAIQIQDLPPLDFIVLSHYHGDHFDRLAEEQLDKSIPIITTLHAARHLARRGFRQTHGIRRWQAVDIVKEGAMPLRITAMPAQHGPGPVAIALPPVIGSLLEFGGENPFRLFISGDTLIHEAFRKIPSRVSDIHIALLYLGGTRVLGILVTMDAVQGVEAIRILQPETAIPIHYNDYTVFKSSLEDFQQAVKEAGFEDRVTYLKHGETFRFRSRTRRVA